MAVVFPTLTGEIAKRGIRKTVMAKRLNISERTLYNKLTGATPFTWEEVCAINECFFPDMKPAELFRKADTENTV